MADLTDLKGKVLLLNSEGCGTADPDLGYEIVMQLFQALPQREDRPKAVIFWNTAVKLLAPGSPLLPHLKKLKEKGTELIAGRMCAGEFCIADDAAVGKLAGMEDILDLILHNEVISL